MNKISLLDTDNFEFCLIFDLRLRTAPNIQFYWNDCENYGIRSV